MNEDIEARARRSIALELSKYYHEASMESKTLPRFSLNYTLAQMATQRGLHEGYELEVCGAAATIAGRGFEPHRVYVPFAALATRDLQVSIGGAGGYLVGSSVQTARDVLRPFSVTAQAGVTILGGLTNSLTMAQVQAGAAAVGTWGSAEGAQIPTTQPSLGDVVMSPKHATAFTRFSRQLTLQAEQTEPFIRAQLLEAVGGLLDQAVIAGTGASGQPQGLTNTSGIGTQAGVALAYSGIRTMRKQIMLAGGVEQRLAWIGAPDVQDALGGRERTAAGGRFLWDDDGVMGRPAYASSYVAPGVLACGDWSRAVVGIWGPGFVVEINPFDQFQQSKLSARIILECDVMFSPSSAFSVATGVT